MYLISYRSFFGLSSASRLMARAGEVIEEATDQPRHTILEVEEEEEEEVLEISLREWS